MWKEISAVSATPRLGPFFHQIIINVQVEDFDL